MSRCPCQRVFRRYRRDEATPRVHHPFWRACPHSTQARFGSYLSTIRSPHPQSLKLETATRLDWQRFSRFFGRWGLAPSPNPGAGPHAGPYPRQRSLTSWTPFPLALAFTLRAAFPNNGKDSRSAVPTSRRIPPTFPPEAGLYSEHPLVMLPQIAPCCKKRLPGLRPCVTLLVPMEKPCRGRWKPAKKKRYANKVFKRQRATFF